MDAENVYRLAALALIVPAITISIYYRHRANQTNEPISTKEEGSLILTLRSLGGLVLWLASLAYLINPGWLAWASLDLPAGLRWTGAAIMLACIPLVYWVFSSLGLNVTPTVVTRAAHTLVTRGPYRWVRHPLYTVGLLLFLGFSLLSASGLILAALLVTFPILMLRTPNEEAHLIERFGDDYRVYMRQTGAFLPRLRLR